MNILKIEDLSVTEELGAKEMSAVRGGFQDSFQANLSGGAMAAGSNGGIGNTTLALVAPTQYNVNVPSSVHNPVAVGIAGVAFAL